MFRLAHEDADRLQLAYACSVHRGQGIELPVSVIVAHPAAGAFFLRREMLYTAITRARLATVIVGSAQVVARAARTPDTARRYGRLGERSWRRPRMPRRRLRCPDSYSCGSCVAASAGEHDVSRTICHEVSWRSNRYGGRRIRSRSS